MSKPAHPTQSPTTPQPDHEPNQQQAQAYEHSQTGVETVAEPTIGIIGLGSIGHHHARRFEQLGADVVGLDVSDDARERFAEEFDTETFARDTALFDAADAVVITTPNKFHEQYAIDALDAGLDVLVEKPLAKTTDAAARIAKAERESDGFVMVGFHMRFSGAVNRFKTLHRNGWFGEIDHVQANYVRQRGIPGRDSWFTSEEIAGGGALIDIGVHALDLALYLLDYPEIEEISATVRSTDPDIDVDDSASAFIRCAGGKTISLEASWTSNLPEDKSFRVSGTEGGATIEPESESLTLIKSDPEDPGGSTVESMEPVDSRDGHRDEAHAFLRAIRTGRPPERNTVEQALTVQQAIDSIYRSSSHDQSVSLDESATDGVEIEINSPGDDRDSDSDNDHEQTGPRTARSRLFNFEALLSLLI